MIYNPETKQFETIAQLRRAFPNTTIPRNPIGEQLSAFNRVHVEQTEPPAGDVVTQGEPVQSDDGVWRQAWSVRDYTQEELADQLKRAKAQKSNSLDNDRDAAFAAGMPYMFGESEDVVQTRPQDQINLMGLASKAQRQLAVGDDTLMPFRGLSNETRMLTPSAMDGMAMAALAHIEGIYAQSWERKDAVDNAETLEAVEGISW